jgi:Flp pilus assembly protein TadG
MFRTRGLATNRDGNFSIMAAILFVPLLLSAGVAIDISTINRTKSDLQQAIDSAALAVAREGKKITDQEAEAIANTFLSGNLHPGFTELQVLRDGTAVQVKAQTRASMAFGALFGYDDWPIVAAASADIAYATYEIALVLDTTGSMAGGKLIAMQDAVIGLIDTMSAQVTDDDKLKFALVPFSTFVNVGAHHGPDFDEKGRQIPGTGADWLDLKGASPVRQVELGTGVSRFQLYHNLGQEWSGCVETRMPGSEDYDVSDAAADPDNAESLYIPAFAIDEPETAGYRNDYVLLPIRVNPLDKTIPAKKKKWAKYGVAANDKGQPLLNGALSDTLELLGLDDDDDDDDDDRKGGRIKSIPIDTSSGKGPSNGCNSQPVTPLTNEYQALKDNVESLKAAGNTNITEGVAWGMRVLSPEEPFSEGQDKFGIEKIMVVLSDGANTFGNNRTELKSAYSSYGYLVDGRLGITGGTSSDSNAKMNAKTLAACSEAKSAGILIYTIRLEEPDVATGTMLQECATSPSHYFDAPSRRQLDEVFQSIRDSIARVRIAS